MSEPSGETASTYPSAEGPVKSVGSGEECVSSDRWSTLSSPGTQGPGTLSSSRPG